MKKKANKYSYEITAWLRALDYLQQENICIKNCLAEIVKRKIKSENLEQIEYYQNLVLNKDTVIAFLRTDIKKMMQEYDNIDFPKRHEILKNDMQHMEKEHINFKVAFATYVQEIISL